jgi:hypothetical protein
MKRFVAVLITVSALASTPVRADQNLNTVLGVVLGAVVVHEIMEHNTNRPFDERPVVVMPQPVYREPQTRREWAEHDRQYEIDRAYREGYNQQYREQMMRSQQMASRRW